MRSKRATPAAPDAPPAAITEAPSAPTPLTDVQDRPGPYVLGRLLVVVAAVLIVSRPMIRGEDPGLTSDFAEPGGLIWVFLALLGCVAWSLWRPWEGEEGVYLGPVEGLLLALGGWQFVAASYAPVRHPAWLASWQWFGLALAVFFVRQVARSPGDRRGLMAALLATGLALAAEGLYQALTPLWSAAPGAEQLREQLREQAYTPMPWEWEEMTRPRRVHGPYFYSAGLAGALVLLTPGLIAAWLACRRGGGPTWQRVALGGAALLAGVILVLTGAGPMIFAAGAVALAILAVAGPSDPRGKVAGAATCAMLAAIAWWALGAAGLMEHFAERFNHVWPAAGRLIAEHPWLGLGTEQFVYYYPRVMDETAGAKVREPGSAVLQVWAEQGAVGLLLLLAVFAVFARAVWRWWRGPAAADDGAAAAGIGWELYLGGMVALVMVFILRAMGLPPDEVLDEALAAGVRAIAWFAGLALVEKLRWPPRLLVGGLTAGVAGLGAALLVGPGVDAPSVVGPLFLAMALVLAVVAPEPLGWLSRLRPVTALLPAVLIALAFGFFALVFYPVANSLSAASRARQVQVFLMTEGSKGTGQVAIRPSTAFIRERVIEPLEAALREDPENLRTRVLLARWYGQLWGLNPLAADNGTSSRRAAEHAAKARQQAPEAGDGYLAEFDLRRRFADRRVAIARAIEEDAKKQKKLTPQQAEVARRNAALNYDDARRQRLLAVEVLLDYLPKDPTDPGLRFALAEVYMELSERGDERSREADRQAGREQAREARRLDGRVGAPRSLSDRQRGLVNRWLGP